MPEYNFAALQFLGKEAKVAKKEGQDTS